MPLIVHLTSLLLQILLFCPETDTSIPWTVPSPQHSPADYADIRRTVQRVLDGPAEVYLKWEYTLTGETLDRVLWRKDGFQIARKLSTGVVVIFSSSQEHFNISRSEQATLVIYNVSQTDGAVFGCTVETHNNEWRDEIQISIVSPPKITSKSSDQQRVNKSSNLQLFCEASGKPSPNITWRKDGSENVLHTGSTWNLMNINISNAGTYHCKADNGVGNAVSYTLEVIVDFSPRIDLNVNYYVAREGNASLNCQAKGYPPPTITWTPCDSQENIKCDESFLNISTVLVSRAIYTCKASNYLGDASANTTLVIGGNNIYLGLMITNKGCSKEKEYDDAFWKILEDEVDKIFRNKKGYAGTELLKVSCGSLIVDLVLKFGANVAEDWALATFREAAKDGTLGELMVNVLPIDGILPVINSTVIPPTTTPTPEPDASNIALIVGLVVGAVVVVAIIVAAILLWRTKKCCNCCAKDTKKVSHDEAAGPQKTYQETSDEKTTVQMAKLEPNVKETRQQEFQGSSRGQYMDLDEARRSHDIPEASQTNTPQISQYAPLHPSTLSWEISRQHVKIEKVIGKGAFGQVAKGTAVGLRGIPQETLVAVKMLKADAPESDKKDLLSELEVMKTLKPHPHVIKLLGCVTESEPLLVLIEYVPYGDLLGYLRKSRGLNDTYYKDPDIKPQTSLTSQQLIKFAWQVADGMSYLSSRSIIHRDLAARNVLIGERGKCKVTDFGMARDVQQENIYERKTKGRLPVKWTAYEALLYGKYTTKSDIWSYGVLLYEIFTIGGSPYPRMDGRKIASLLQQGYRMPKPQHVDDELYKIMMMCWEEEPNARPTFVDLRTKLKKIDKQNKKYINMNMYDTKLYANVEDLVV